MSKRMNTLKSFLTVENKKMEKLHIPEHAYLLRNRLGP